MADGSLWPDAERIRQGLDCTIAGMSEIKRRRLEELEAPCHPGTKVGSYVPFYFCFRSIMLYLLHSGNHAELDYRGGQTPIEHLETDLDAVAGWAEENGVRWAFSNGNAGARYVIFHREINDMTLLDWDAIGATDWKASAVRQGKQAEFLIERALPWEMVERIGVIDIERAQRVAEILADAWHKPEIVVQRNRYS